MKLPDCYEADRMFDSLDMEYTKKLMRRPVCQRCGRHIDTDTYLDLSDFGGNGYVCQRCVEFCTYTIEDWEEF